ncbi:hypothetical protein FEM03_19675 [Phragmitibacter flavus]|uniref:Uncharacterized protein n=1 Tax=Phragmitibacter flavus TaxID=2576071 RepID=A0A5R8KBZ6_9BACT|nr:hypothetical protein [Phragmitibacter flavus]TLD69089.1 hypothetical protein FEM03_19675 [Phragmitibacter flavus]
MDPLFTFSAIRQLTRRLFAIGVLSWLFCNPPVLSAEERQGHGLDFERWVRSTFFENYQPAQMTQKWDIPAAANQHFGNLAATVKSSKYGSQIDLGDARRQFDIASQQQSFLFIIGFWKPQRKNQKQWVHAVAPTITARQYRKLWHPITSADLERLDAVIKDRSLSMSEARQQAHLIKSSPPFNLAIIKVNPKIDINQRRLQCSLRFADFFQYLAPDENAQLPPSPKLFNRPLPTRLPVTPRHTTDP